MASDPSSIVVNEFLMCFIADRETGDRHDLAFYLAQFAGHENAIREEWARLHESVEDEDASDQRIGPYRLEEEIGRGGQALVRRAQDTRDGSRVALKTIRCDAQANIAEAFLRLNREAQVLRELDHEGICPILEFGREENTLYIAMPLLTGQTLAERFADPKLDRNRDWREQLMTWVAKLALALDHGHRRQVIHRDVKPSNVMIDGAKATLFDFGVARLMRSGVTTLTDEGTQLGTPIFMAPEVIAMEKASEAADIYALGVILYQGLCGKTPFRGETRDALFRAIALGHYDRGALQSSGANAHLVAVVETAMAQDPHDRYASARALRDDLLAVQKGRRPSIHRINPMTALIKKAKRRPVLSALLFVLVLSTLASAGFGGYLVENRRAYRAAELRKTRADFDRQVTLAFDALWSHHEQQAHERFATLKAKGSSEDRFLMAALDVGLAHSTDKSPSHSSNEPRLQAFAAVHDLIQEATTSDPEKTTATIEALSYLIEDSTMLVDVARVHLARTSKDSDLARRATLGLRTRWKGEPQVDRWVAMAHERSHPDQSLRLYGDEGAPSNSWPNLTEAIASWPIKAERAALAYRLRKTIEVANEVDEGLRSTQLERLSEIVQ